MSKILRLTEEATTVYIGERQYDREKDSEAERVLSELFPEVSVMTGADGKKLIPVQEISKIKKTLVQERNEHLETGRQEGYQKGLAEGLAEAEKVMRDFDDAIKDAINERQRLYEEARSNILSLVVKISRQVTFDAVAADPEVTIKLIKGVIDTLIDRSTLKIKVNPDHLPIVEQNIDRFLHNDSTIKEIKIEPDPRVKYGGCFIETLTGDVDARLESQFNTVEQALIAEDN